MASTYKVLAQGQLPNAAATIYTVPGATKTVISKVVIVNNDSAARTWGLSINGTGATKVIVPSTASIPAGGFAIWTGADTLNAAETLAGVASVASQLTYTIFGDEVT